MEVDLLKGKGLNPPLSFQLLEWTKQYSYSFSSQFSMLIIVFRY